MDYTINSQTNLTVEGGEKGMLIAILVLLIVLTIMWGAITVACLCSAKADREKVDNIDDWFKRASIKEIEEQIGKRALKFRTYEDVKNENKD